MPIKRTIYNLKIKKMYKQNGFNKSTIDTICRDKGISIEEKMRQIKANKERIEAISPNIYTERKDGVNPVYDIRTDKFEIAAEAGNMIAATHFDARNKIGEEAQKNMKIEDGQAESTHGTTDKNE